MFGHGRMPRSKTDQFWQYGIEAILWASYAKTDDDRQGLLELARTWTQAALQERASLVDHERDRCRVRTRPLRFLAGRQKKTRIFTKSGVGRGVSVCNQYKEANHDKHQQDAASTNLQALFVGGHRMRNCCRNNIRNGNYPTCSGSQNLPKSGQIPGITKGCCDVQQLQTFRCAELVPNC
jgi:hypothetical protein